jgi:SAM-dependent methyltransferase
MDAWLRESLVCPRDLQTLQVDADHLTCPAGHCYPLIDGIPILLLEDQRQTIEDARRSLRAARTPAQSEEPRTAPANGIDPHVQQAVAATNGIMYRSLLGKLSEYPIPNLLLPPGAGQRFLDIGCNWGRWCVAAARLGYRPVGLDPSLEAIRAARRVAAQLGIAACFVVGDGRFLPFRDGVFDVVFSYSVLQHFSRDDVRTALSSVARVLRPQGTSLIQMANSFGPRSLYHQLRRGFREPGEFDVRYWTPAALLRTFGALIGPSQLAVDGILTLNPQTTEAHLLPWRYRSVVHLSMLWRRLSQRFTGLAQVADSLYISSRKGG